MTEASEDGTTRTREGNPSRTQQDGSITIERWMMERLSLKGTAAIIYAAIWQAGPAGIAASIPAIAHKAGVSPKSAKRCLAALKESRLIEVLQSSEGHSRPRTWTATIWSDPLDKELEKGLE